MGVNNSSISFIIFADPPSSLEQFVQIIGRGGRNGDNCRITLLFMKADFNRYRRSIEASKTRTAAQLRQVDDVEHFCLTPECRHVVLRNFFEEENVKKKSPN